MKFSSIFFATASFLFSVVAAWAQQPASSSDTISGKPMSLYVRFDQPSGELRAIHAANFVPYTRGSTPNLTMQQKTLGIPLVRTHDVVAPLPGAVDISVIFPNFQADAEDPANYHFAVTDDYIQALIDGGSQVFFRLGESIEHTPKKYFVNPPKDFAKWANIAVHVIRHYNNGWANGFHHNIRYWEIWNEPDGTDCWTGTPQQFYELYETSAKVIKAYDPNLKIGGPAFCGRRGLRTSYVDDFLKYCRDRQVPLDFFSWHNYSGNPGKLLEIARYARTLLDGYGFTKTENVLGEWNYHPTNWHWRNDLLNVGKPLFEKRIHGAEGASYIASVLIYLQDVPLDMSYFYVAGASVRWGLFDMWGAPRKSYYAFLAFRQLLDCPLRVQAGDNNLDEGLAVLAGVARDNHSAAILVSRLSGETKEFDLEVTDLPWKGNTRCQRFLLDNQHDLTLIATDNIAAEKSHVMLPLPAASVYLLRFEPTK